MALLIGIDVGGTHADGVLVDGESILVKNKVLVDQDNLSESIIALLQSLVPDNPGDVSRIHLSTTLCTNAIVNQTYEPVGMLIQSGPGMNPAFLDCGEHVCFIDGAIDHRGHIIKKPSDRIIEDAATAFQQHGITSVGVVTKFSHRNNAHEEYISNQLTDAFPHISKGHRISGLPNFPRRVYSTWLNAALKSRFMFFKQAMETGLHRLGLTCPCHILKADGGTIPFGVAGDTPCESVHSGPSASVMGCMALKTDTHDAILLDIGGTTTDIAILADGSPLLEPYGVTIRERPTLIRALNTTSVGLGGDSAVFPSNDGFTIGPHKSGPPMALGGSTPTPTDAMIVIGSMKIGDKQRAVDAMLQLHPNQKPHQTAEQLLAAFADQIYNAVDHMIDEVFSRPVYTVAALLNRKRINPEEIIIVGGPAQAMQEILAERFQLQCSVPHHFEVANAIGAARTRPTVQATLYADTTDKTLSIPEIGCRENIRSYFDMEDAEKRLTEVITTLAGNFGMDTLPEIDFLERQEMNTVKGFSSSGKIISLKAQIRPGLDLLQQEDRT